MQRMSLHRVFLWARPVIADASRQETSTRYGFVSDALAYFFNESIRLATVFSISVREAASSDQ